VKKALFQVGEIVFTYNKWNNEIEKGEITNIREAKYNWDYSIRYYIFNDLIYSHWVEEKYISRDEQSLFKFLV
jgi:hypothetical protein